MRLVIFVAEWVLTGVPHFFPLLQALIVTLISLKPCRGVLACWRGATEHPTDDTAE